VDGDCIQGRRIYLEHENAFRENLRRRADNFIHKFLTFSIQAAVFCGGFLFTFTHIFIYRIHLFIAEINAMLAALHLCTNRFIAIFICTHYLFTKCCYLLFTKISYLQLFIKSIYLQCPGIY